jgi:hypothetical protein
VKAGETVNGGPFTYTSSKEFTEQLQSVTMTVSNPSLLSSLTLNATVGDTNASATVTPPTSTSVFTFNPPISVPPGATVNFSLSAVVAGTATGTTAGLIQASFGGFNSGKGMRGGGSGNSHALHTAMGLLREAFPLNASSGRSLMALLGAILPLLLMTFLFQSGVRQRAIAAGFGIVMFTMTMSGCDPCPSCADHLKSTVQVLVAVTITDTEGNQLSVTGLPVNLSQISM